jgi:hypothetical protein
MGVVFFLIGGAMLAFVIGVLVLIRGSDSALSVEAYSGPILPTHESKRMPVSRYLLQRVFQKKNSEALLVDLIRSMVARKQPAAEWLRLILAHVQQRGEQLPVDVLALCVPHLGMRSLSLSDLLGQASDREKAEAALLQMLSMAEREGEDGEHLRQIMMSLGKVGGRESAGALFAFAQAHRLSADTMMAMDTAKAMIQGRLGSPEAGGLSLSETGTSEGTLSLVDGEGGLSFSARVSGDSVAGLALDTALENVSEQEEFEWDVGHQEDDEYLSELFDLDERQLNKALLESLFDAFMSRKPDAVFWLHATVRYLHDYDCRVSLRSLFWLVPIIGGSSLALRDVLRRQVKPQYLIDVLRLAKEWIANEEVSAAHREVIGRVASVLMGIRQFPLQEQPDSLWVSAEDKEGELFVYIENWLTTTSPPVGLVRLVLVLLQLSWLALPDSLVLAFASSLPDGAKLVSELENEREELQFPSVNSTYAEGVEGTPASRSFARFRQLVQKTRHKRPATAERAAMESSALSLLQSGTEKEKKRR